MQCEDPGTMFEDEEFLDDGWSLPAHMPTATAAVGAQTSLVFAAPSSHPAPATAPATAADADAADAPPGLSAYQSLSHIGASGRVAEAPAPIAVISAPVWAPPTLPEEPGRAAATVRVLVLDTDG
jgi:hypothetical protein